MKIYTRSGDDGSTGLLGGSRTSKSDRRIDCVGAIDELNASIGWAAVAVADAHQLETLRMVQNELFVAGSHLAAPDVLAAKSIPPMDEAAIDRLEREIDAATERLPPLRNFILPGGCEASARLHMARTVCRRTERAIVAFGQDRPVAPIVTIYLNRLSDWLFIQARLANHLAGLADILWHLQ